MEFSIKELNNKKPLAQIPTDCLVIGVFEEEKLSNAARALQIDKTLKTILASGDISGKAGSILLLRDVAACSAKRIVLLGLGKLDKKGIAAKDFKKALSTLWNLFAEIGAKDALWVLPTEGIVQHNLAWMIEQTVNAGFKQQYRFEKTLSKKEAATSIKKFAIVIASQEVKEAQQALEHSVAIGQGCFFAKDLANTPANLCTPADLAGAATKLAKDYKALKVQVLERKQIETLKMGSFLSVAQGSETPPRFIVMQDHGASAKAEPVVLVGKGVTFDSGGISLKPGLNMDEMKYDMSGAASVLGVFKAVAELKLKINLVGLIPATENMPSGRAVKPGDVVTSMSGQTIEILNTDAEGRLILCDALTYAERFKPAYVIDIATLTGACVVALGHHHSGLFTRDDEAHQKLAKALVAAGKASDDTVWPMPLDDAYQEQLKSNFADIANIGGPPAGSVTAACFLERFTKKYCWAHLDIAGTAWKSGPQKGATGRPVPLLTRFLINYVQQ